MLRSAVIVLVATLCGVASASQPPPSREDLIRDANERALVSRVRACSSAAGRRSYFGAAEVAIRYRKQNPPLAVLRRRHGIPADQARCIAKVLRTLSLQPTNELGTYTVVVGVGAPESILPDDALVAWQRAVRHRERGALTAMLPSYITLSAKGCLRVRGPSTLWHALVGWVQRKAPAEIGVLHRVLRPLSDDWWFVHQRSPDDDAGTTYPDVCLEHAAPALTAVRTGLAELEELPNGKLDLEYTVDVNGVLVGDIGACFAFDGDMRTTRAVLAERRQELETKLRALHHGKRRRLERVSLRARAERPLQLWTNAVATPLARGDSQVEARCDTTQALECLRAEHEYKPLTFDSAALDRCIAAARSSREDLAVSFDISGAGRVKELEAYSLSVKAKRDTYDDRPTLPPALARCIGAVFARARFPSTSGGDCYASMGLDAFP